MSAAAAIYFCLDIDARLENDLKNSYPSLHHHHIQNVDLTMSSEASSEESDRANGRIASPPSAVVNGSSNGGVETTQTQLQPSPFSGKKSTKRRPKPKQLPNPRMEKLEQAPRDAQKASNRPKRRYRKKKPGPIDDSDKENSKPSSGENVSLLEKEKGDGESLEVEESVGLPLEILKGIKSTESFVVDASPTVVDLSANKKKSVSELIHQHEGRNYDSGKPTEISSRWKRTISAPEEAKSNPFDVTLRATKIQNSNGRITSESLPKIQPIKTIIGLSHQQILDLDLTDVKVKTIMSSSKVSKFAQNALAFVVKHSDDIFQDQEKKLIFFKLCISVALYESIGFRKSTRACPQIVEWFGGLEEITLEKTRTKLTPSNKDIHQNEFDYSVLSYFGHLLIWALYHQRSGGTALFIDKYDIELAQTTIRSSIGGFHLWDRLIRESKGMNSKRWKHVIKFRTSFAYEEDQFMLMLRFMRVDKVIP